MNFRSISVFFTLVLILGASFPAKSAEIPVEGISFAVNPGRIYLPIEEAARLLKWDLVDEDKTRKVVLNGRPLDFWSLRRLLEGGRLVHLSHLVQAGAETSRDEETGVVTVRSETAAFGVVPGEKRVLVDLEARRLKAWQGDRLVLDCHISAGRGRRTPAGDFRAGPYKARHHYSSRYNNAPMPYSVQISGHIFIHGFRSVPDYPASHGCIRMHLDRGNPARFFYEWVDRGVPIRIVRETPKEAPESSPVTLDGSQSPSAGSVAAGE